MPDHLTTSDLIRMLTNADEPRLPPTTLVYVQIGAERRPLIAMTTQYSADPPTHVILRDVWPAPDEDET